MNENNRTKKSSLLDRRNFLKISSLTVAGASLLGGGVAKAAGKTRPGKKSFSLFRKEYESIDDIYEISSTYKRMDQKKTIFSRAFWDSPIAEPQGLFKSFYGKFLGLLPNSMNSEPGFSPIAHALDVASWAGENTGAPMSSGGIRNYGPSNNWELHSNPTAAEKYNFESRSEARTNVKRASKFLGADLVGIAPYDERWVYSKWYDFSKTIYDENKKPVHEDAKFPFEVKSVIAVAFEMDHDALKAPGYISDSAVGLEYSHMTEVTHRIAVFLNHLGYKAIPCGNDTAMSIPIAAQAGLGELSRMGILISEKYGPRIRLAKVFTDLEMDYDKPNTFGVQDFCKKCMKCADACPSKSISLDQEPTIEPKTGCISNHPGVKKWYQNQDKCLGQWEKLGTGCTLCVSVCPYNKLDTWVHDVAKLAVGVPVGRDIARQLDDAFGYGKVKAENVEKFWSGLDEDLT